MTTTDSTADPPEDPTEPAALVAEMRAEVEAAAEQLDALTAALQRWEGRVDELESVLDVVLRMTDQLVAVVGDDLRLVGLSAAAARALDLTGVHLPAHLTPALAALVDGWRRHGGDEADVSAGDWSARAVGVPAGGVVLVLAPTS
jgi:hypothetical protein